MTLHLKKLSVGSTSLEELDRWQAMRLENEGELKHVTRNTPRRGDEILAGGSIYWIIKGVMCVRQNITELRPVEREDGKPACAIVLAPGLVAVEPRRVRIFQGWRYLEGRDAPADIVLSGGGDAGLPPAMMAELRELGIL